MRAYVETQGSSGFRQLALSPEASLSARAWPRLPQAPASLGRSAAWAALAGHTGLVLEIGARAGAKDAKGRTPLLLARQLDRGKGDAKLLSMLEYSIQGQAPAVPMGHGGLV